MAVPGMHMQLVDWLDDLSVRFIINLPQEELESSERICFQIEEAQWYYEDFIRPLDPTLPSLNLRKFCGLMFQHCPIFAGFSDLHATVYAEFIAYKTRVPVRGAIMLNEEMDQVVLVKGWKKGAKWSFPRGKINKDEKDIDCAVREVDEETGFDIRRAGLVPEYEEDAKYIEMTMREQQMRLYVFRDVPMDTIFEPKTRKEISKIEWWKLADLPTLKKEKQLQQQAAELGEEAVAKASTFYMVAPFLGQLKAWIKQQKRADKAKARAAHPRQVIVEDEETANEDYLQSDAPPDMTDTNDGSAHYNALLGMLRSSKGEPAALGIAPANFTTAPQELDPAAQLKRLLSVPLPQPPTVATRPAPAEAPSMNPLLAILQGKSNAGGGQPLPFHPPRTPLEQIQNIPPMATTPHHHHPHAPPTFSDLPPPPMFSLGSAQIAHRQPPPSGPVPPSQSIATAKTDAPLSLIDMIRRNNPAQTTAPRSYNSAALVAPSQTPTNIEAMHTPAASALPQPKLSSQKMALLNAFQTKNQPTNRPPAEKSLGLIPAGFVPSTVRPGGGKSALPSPDNAAPPSKQMFHEVAAPAIQKNALLDLFKTPGTSVASAVSQPRQDHLVAPAQAPVELAAQASPHMEKPSNGLGANPLGLNVHINHPRGSPELTSATVTGPLNAPDFETVRQRAGAELSAAQAVASEKPADEATRSSAVRRHHNVEAARSPARHQGRDKIGRSPRAGLSQSPCRPGKPSTDKPFTPTILKRPPQPALESKSQTSQREQQHLQPSPGRSGPQILARPSNENPGEQRDSLLALFSKPAPGAPGMSAVHAVTPSPTSVPSVRTPNQASIISPMINEMPATMYSPPSAPKLGPELGLSSSLMSPLSPLAGGSPAMNIWAPTSGVNRRPSAGIGFTPLTGASNGSPLLGFGGSRAGNASTASLSEMAAFPTSGLATPTSVPTSNAARQSFSSASAKPTAGVSTGGQSLLSLLSRNSTAVAGGFSGVAAGPGREKERVGSLASVGSTGSLTPITPVDKSFLLGYLENVAKGGGPASAK